MEAVTIFRELGLAALVIIIVLGIVIIRTWSTDKRRSFSENIAKNKKAYLLFAPIFSIVTVMYYAFLWAWVGPYVGAPVLYYGLLSLAFVLQLVVAWVPASRGLAMLIHSIAAYSVALIMPLIILSVLIAGAMELGMFGNAAGWTFIVATIILFYIFFFVLQARKYFLVFQAGYFMLFWAVMLVWAYS